MTIESKALRFYQRTVEHIHRVQSCAVLLATRYNECLGLDDEKVRILLKQVLEHDKSKFDPLLCRGYIEVNEFHYQRRTRNVPDYDYASENDKLMANRAVDMHQVLERHHPERLKYMDQSDPSSSKVWTVIDSIECACDLQAMANEFGEGTCRTYFEGHWKQSKRPCFRSELDFALVVEMMDKCIRCFEQEEKNNKDAAIVNN